jgi:hypothetical protein
MKHKIFIEIPPYYIDTLILLSKNHGLKKMVGGATKTDLFDEVFGIYMLWGIQKQ